MCRNSRYGKRSRVPASVKVGKRLKNALSPFQKFTEFSGAAWKEKVDLVTLILGYAFAMTEVTIP